MDNIFFKESIMVHPAYVAGFFDGEGSVSFDRRPTGKRVPFVRIVLSNNNYEILGIIADSLGIRGVITEPNKNRTTYQLVMGSYKDVKAFVDAVEPYVFVKRKQLAIAKEFVDHVLGTEQRGAPGVSDEEVEWRLALRERLLQANAERGVADA